MRINKNRINTEITHNEILLNMYRTDPVFKKTIDTINNHDIRESELLNILVELCLAVQTYRDKYSELLETSTIVIPFTKEEKEALRFFDGLKV